MKHEIKILLGVLIIAILFIPFYPVKVVPEWELIFVDKNNKPISSVGIQQSWKDYSLEYWDAGMNMSQVLETNSNGYVKLPERKIRISTFQIISSPIRDFIMSINPHAGYGSDSFLVCMNGYTCVVSYDEKKSKPQVVNIR